MLILGSTGAALPLAFGKPLLCLPASAPSDAKYDIPPGISNYGNSESAPFIIALRKFSQPFSVSPHTPIGALRNPESGI